MKARRPSFAPLGHERILCQRDFARAGGSRRYNCSRGHAGLTHAEFARRDAGWEPGSRNALQRASTCCWHPCPTRRARPPLSGAPAPGIARRLRPHLQFARGPALRRESLLLQHLSLAKRCCAIPSASCRWPIPAASTASSPRKSTSSGCSNSWATDSQGVPPGGGPGALPPPPVAAHRAARRAGPGAPSRTSPRNSRNLADAILDLAYRRIRDEFVARHGEPRLPRRHGPAASP